MRVFMVWMGGRAFSTSMQLFIPLTTILETTSCLCVALPTSLASATFPCSCGTFECDSRHRKRTHPRTARSLRLVLGRSR
ncbi:hypothetical protein C8R45DRAFT_1036945 [Mycena sanguinolenta]|nr:hypothetical protein C8R45DRAFT_1036945 [Mycena sanguinolenta]